MSALGRKSDQVYNWIRAYIDENKFSANLKLPSEHVICMRLDVSRETVRYCGTPLKYSFSEAGHQKSVTVVELGTKGAVSVRTVPLAPPRTPTPTPGS